MRKDFLLKKLKSIIFVLYRISEFNYLTEDESLAIANAYCLIEDRAALLKKQLDSKTKTKPKPSPLPS